VSHPIKTKEDLTTWLNSIPMFSTSGKSAYKPGLERMISALEEMGNPHKNPNINFIHVAGTNGKGTVCSMLTSVFLEAGLTAGVFLSPHVLELNERFQLNGKMISDDEMVRLFDQHIELFERHHLSYFEQMTAIAFAWFNENQPNVIILETGLGGRLDATNVVTPMLSIITSTGLDHTDILGETIAEIAGEKAGIIKKNKPVITGNILREALSVIRKKSELEESDLLSFSEEKNMCSYDEINPEIINRWIVEKTCLTVAPKFNISSEAKESGIESYRQNVCLPGRFERLLPEEKWFFDGAHNAEAIQNTITKFKSVADPALSIVIIAMMRDKKPGKVLSLFSEFKKILYYSIDSERAEPYEALSKKVEGLHSLTDQESRSIFKKHRSEPILCIGSFYFYATVKMWIADQK
jgi:dihydrofolate synthase/folylpolyglutamate synthase